MDLKRTSKEAAPDVLSSEAHRLPEADFMAIAEVGHTRLAPSSTPAGGQTRRRPTPTMEKENT
jgi:hypothetical protein